MPYPSKIPNYSKLKSKILSDKETFYRMYIVENQSQQDLAEYYNVPIYLIKKINLQNFKFFKTKESIKKYQKDNNKKYGKKDIDFDIFQKLYYIDLLGIKEIEKIMGCSMTTIYKHPKFVPRPNRWQVANRNATKTNILKYGVKNVMFNKEVNYLADEHSTRSCILPINFSNSICL